MLKFDDNPEGYTSGEGDSPYEIVDSVSFMSISKLILFGVGKFNGLFMQSGVSKISVLILKNFLHIFSSLKIV